MKKIKLFIIMLVFISAVIGCKKEDPNPAGNLLTGDLIGYTYLYDEHKIREADNSGIIVSIDGTSISTTTGIDGRWILKNLHLGTYTFVMSKPDFGTIKNVGKEFVGNGQSYYGTSNLYTIPKYTIDGINDSVTYTINSIYTAGTIIVYGTFTQGDPLTYAYFRLFAGKNPDVSSDPSKNFCTIIGDVLGNLGLTQFYLFLQTRTLNNFGIVSGDTIYIVVYADSYTSSAYIDLNTGRYFYPNLNPKPSNILKVIVP